LVRTIKGRSQKVEGGVEIYFEGYGKFLVDKPGPLDIWCYGMPVYPDPLDSLEDYTNIVTITLED
jgi:hypothetical protein